MSHRQVACCLNGAFKLIILLSLCCGQSVLAATRQVCPSGCTHSNIADAISASGAADTIQIIGGVYEESVDLGFAPSSLTFMGGYNSDFSARDPVSNPTIVRYFRLNSFYSGSITVDGLGVVGSTSQGFVVSNTSSSLTLRNCDCFAKQYACFSRAA